MKKNILQHRLIVVASAVAMLLLLIFSLASCSDDDDNEGQDPETERGSDATMPEHGESDLEVPSGEAPETAEEIAARDSMKTDMLMRSLCDVHIDEITSAVTYTPIRGEAIHPATPTVYYAIAFNEEHARSIYESIVFVALEEGQKNSVPDKVKQGDIQVSYSKAGSSDGELGRISVECPRLKDVLSSIVFVSDNAWPGNDVATPCNFLSVWKEVKTGYYYLCLQEARGGKGLLVTWDGGWTDDWFTDSYWQWNFCLSAGCMHQDHYELLVGALNYNSTKFKNALHAMLDASNRKSKSSLLLDDLYYHPWINHRCVCDYSWRHGKWWARTNYYVDLRFVNINNKSLVKYSVHYEHRDWPTDRNNSSSFKIFTQRDAAQFKDTSQWDAIYR